MRLDLLISILIVAVILIAAGVAIWFAIRAWRSKKLREKFGPEYDYTMEKAGDRRTAEAALEERKKRVDQLVIRDLNVTEKNRYHEEWTKIQAHFVDNPSQSVLDANRLITEVMIVRGFPVADFEQRTADLSVMYPDLVSNYRSAYAIASKDQSSTATTEELRQAMVDFRSMAAVVLGVESANEGEAGEKVREVTTS